jgi:hypothetical protein
MRNERTIIRDKDVRDPSRLHNNIINDYVAGNLDESQFLHRAVVIEIDHKGGKWKDDPDQPAPNPPNSFRGRVISNGMDRNTDIDELPVFWPLFPHDVFPIKEGEEVYVIFEDSWGEHGLWIARVPEHADVNDLNVTPGKKKYEEDDNNDTSSVGVDQAHQDLDEKPDPIETSEEFVVEPVPLFESRVGDRVMRGSNNTTIVMGRDRKNATKDDGHKEESGTIDLFAGKATDDGNLDSDQPGTSRLYISMKTDIDENLGAGADFDGPGDQTEVAAIGMKSDEIRIVAKENAKIVVGGGDGSQVTIVMGTDGKLQIEAKNEVTIKCDKINLGGENLTEPVVLGMTFLTQLQTMLTAISTEMGGAGTFLTIPGVAMPASSAAIGTFLGAIETFKSKVVKTK